MLLFERRTPCSHPSSKTGFELLRVQQGKNAPKGIVRGDAIGERQVLAQSVEFHLAPFDNRDPAFRTADDGADRGQPQFVQLICILARQRIAQLFEG